MTDLSEKKIDGATISSLFLVPIETPISDTKAFSFSFSNYHLDIPSEISA